MIIQMLWISFVQKSPCGIRVWERMETGIFPYGISWSGRRGMSHLSICIIGYSSKQPFPEIQFCSYYILSEHIIGSYFSLFSWLLKFKRAEKYFEPIRGEPLLDVSCGSGLFSRRFLKSAHYSTVVASDFSSSMLSQCKEFLSEDKSLDLRQIPPFQNFPRIFCSASMA